MGAFAHALEHRDGDLGKSAKIIRGIPFSSPPTVEDALEEAAEIITRAYSGTSESAVCTKAAKDLGVDEGVIRRILRKETKNPSWPLLRHALERIDDPWELPAIRRFVQRMMAKGGK